MITIMRVIDQSYSTITLRLPSFRLIIKRVTLRIFPTITKGGPRCGSHGPVEC